MFFLIDAPLLRVDVMLLLIDAAPLCYDVMRNWDISLIRYLQIANAPTVQSLSSPRATPWVDIYQHSSDY
jgi:hypothetical protein